MWMLGTRLLELKKKISSIELLRIGSKYGNND
jgi:hypothetical protein